MRFSPMGDTREILGSLLLLKLIRIAEVRNRMKEYGLDLCTF